MKILVIGGAGYIGSHVVRCFLDQGDVVTVYDNLSSGCRENLFDEAEFIHGDILDSRMLDGAMAKGFDCVVHLAAFKAAGESMIEPEKYATNNICGTINILNSAVRRGVKNFVFSSSAAVYGEPQYLPIDEAHPTNPINFYGFTKLEIERILRWYDELRGIRFAALRYFNAAGYDVHGRIAGLERNPANLLPVIMEVAVGIRSELQIYGNDYDTEDGTCIRDYIHVNDLAEAHVAAFKYIDTANRSVILNLGSQNGISVRAMVEAARRITGRPIVATISGRRSGDCAKLVASSATAEKVLGWKARYSGADTLISSTWAAYKKHYS